MMGKGRIMHVLGVVCWVSSVVYVTVAYPTGDVLGDVVDPDAYSPSYDFVDEYLHNNEQTLSPSDSELGDLIWGILYQPQTEYLSLKRGLPERREVLKRQQGWHVNYGKRNSEKTLSPNTKLQKLRLFSERQDDLGDPYKAYGKRQQGWYTQYGKRNTESSQWHESPANTEETMDMNSDLPLTWLSRVPSFRQVWYPNYMSRDPEMTQIRKRQQGWHVDYGKRNGDFDSFVESKRQQGWHTDYGKR